MELNGSKTDHSKTTVHSSLWPSLPKVWRGDSLLQNTVISSYLCALGRDWTQFINYLLEVECAFICDRRLNKTSDLYHHRNTADMLMLHLFTCITEDWSITEARDIQIIVTDVFQRREPSGLRPSDGWVTFRVRESCSTYCTVLLGHSIHGAICTDFYSITAEVICDKYPLEWSSVRCLPQKVQDCIPVYTHFYIEILELHHDPIQY